MIRQLQRRADPIRPLEQRRIGVAVKMQDETADGIGGETAISEERLEVFITIADAVDSKRLQKIPERLPRQIETPSGLHQGDEDRVLRIPLQAALQHTTPLIQSIEALSPMTVLIGEVVGDPGEGVDRLDGRPDGGGQQERGDRKILVVTPREARAEPLRLSQGRGAPQDRSRGDGLGSRRG